MLTNFPEIIIFVTIEKKTLRKSTADRTKQIAEREKERDVRAKMLKDIALQKRVAEVRRLTQEELLEEAKVTEELNLMSLGKAEGASRVTSSVHIFYITRYTNLSCNQVGQDLIGRVQSLPNRIKVTASICKHVLCDNGTSSCSGVDVLMQ